MATRFRITYRSRAYSYGILDRQRPGWWAQFSGDPQEYVQGWVNILNSDPERVSELEWTY